MHLHRFRDIALEKSKIAIIGYLSFRFNPRRRGYPGTICVQIFIESSQMANEPTKWHRNISENFNRMSRVHERYRQTDDTTDRRMNDRIMEITVWQTHRLVIVYILLI